MRFGLLIVMVFARAALAQGDPDPWFAPDKALHFSLSAGIAGVGYGGASLFTEDRRARLALGAGLALVAGAAKELADLAGLGHPSWRDFAWDLAGNGVGLIVSLLLDRFVITPLTATPSLSSQLAPAG